MPGTIICKPNIVVDDIQIEMDKNATKYADRIIDEWGKNIPIVKIGDYVLNVGDLREFSLEVALNNLPTFSMVINDEQYTVRENLKNNIDKCVIFIGYKDWYLKFNGIIKKSYSNIGSSIVRLSGEYYNPLLFEGQQFSYKDKKISDILKDVCEKTSMGLFTYDNIDLNNVLDYSLMTGTRYIDYINFLLKTYTTNLFSFDCNSYLHISDIETLRNQPYDKYSLDWSTGKKIDEKDIIFQSIYKNDEPNGPEKNYKIPIDYYVINTNFSEIFTETYGSYSLGFGGNNEEIIKSDINIGIGSNKTNTFFGFKKHKFPYYNDRINKLIGGNLITLTTKNIIFELTALSTVGVEIYLPYVGGKGIRLDEEHSGKKILIGYTINFRKKADELNMLTQTLKLI